MSGMSAGNIHSILSVREIFHETLTEFEDKINSLNIYPLFSLKKRLQNSRNRLENGMKKIIKKRRKNVRN
jgi:hypothetical protein